MDDTVCERKALVAQAAVAQGLLGGDTLLAGFVDLGGMRQAVGALRSSFPYHFTHAFSAKAGCLEGILRPLPEGPPTESLPIFGFLHKLWRYREDMVYLSPAPLYHSAPNAAVGCCWSSKWRE